MKITMLFLSIFLLSPSLLASTNTSLAPLVLWWHSGRLDNFTASTKTGHSSARSANYGKARIEGCIPQAPLPDTRPLYLYWLGVVGDNASVSGWEAIDRVRSEGYSKVRLQGYVYDSYKEGLVPLVLFYRGLERDDYFSTATEVGKSSAISAGYTNLGTIGYILPASSCS